MRQIKVSDETHERLQADADKHFRTIGGQIDYLIAYEGNAPAEKNKTTDADKHEAQTPQQVAKDLYAPSTQAERVDVPLHVQLYQEAKQMQADLIEDLKFNQDPDSRHQMERERGEAIQAKWAEYHAAKNQ